MHVKVDADERKQVYVHYVSTPVPFVVEENYAEYYNIEDDDFVQVLHDQETLIRSLQRNSSIDEPGTPSAANSRVPNQDQTQGREQQNQSETITDQSQLLIDEALARSLQELDNEFSSTSINERTVTGPDSSSNGSSSRSGEGSSTGSATPTAQDDDVDPDNMTYEELQTLADAVGTETKGLSDDLISYLPTSTYKVGLFSKKNRGDKCVICQTDYEHRDRLMNLTCQHQYHLTCITTWLKISKVRFETVMECNKEEAQRAKEIAERKMQNKDFVGACRIIQKAQRLDPDIEDISKMLAICNVHCSSNVKINGEADWYGILQNLHSES